MEGKLYESCHEDVYICESIYLACIYICACIQVTMRLAREQNGIDK